MPKNGTLRKKKRLKARRGMDKAAGRRDEGSNGAAAAAHRARARADLRGRAADPARRGGHEAPGGDDDDARRPREERRQRSARKRRGEAPPPPGSVAAAAAAAALPDELAPAWTGDAPSKRTLGGGIVIEDTALGEGREARHASSVDVAYEAFVLREDGEVRGTAIDRATARDPYASFVVGSRRRDPRPLRGRQGHAPGRPPRHHGAVAVRVWCQNWPPKVPPKVLALRRPARSRWARGS